MSGSDTRFLLAMLALIFLFSGDPDVWDKLHDRAMQTEVCK